MSDGGQSDLPLPQWLMSEKAKAAALEAAEQQARAAAKKRAEERARVQQRLATDAWLSEREGQVKPSDETSTQFVKNNQVVFGRPHRSHISGVGQTRAQLPEGIGDLDIPNAPDEAERDVATLDGRPRFTKAPLLKVALARSSMTSPKRENPPIKHASDRSRASSASSHAARQDHTSDPLSSTSASGEDIEVASALDAFVKDQIRAEAEALARRRERSSDRPLVVPQATPQATPQAPSQATPQAPTQAPIQAPIHDTRPSLTPPQLDPNRADGSVQPMPAHLSEERSAAPAGRVTPQPGILGRLWNGLTNVVRALILFIFLLLCSLVAGFLFGYLGIANSL